MRLVGFWPLDFGLKSLVFVALLSRTVNAAKTKDLRPKAEGPRPKTQDH
jgi:hypothetical protein